VRVLHVMESTIGGTRRHIADVASGQRALGLDVHLAVATEREPRFLADLERLEHEGIHVERLPMVRSIAPGLDLAHGRRLAGLLRTLRPDVVHTHSSKAGVLGRLASIATGIGARVHTPHTFAFLFAAMFGPLKRRLFREIEIGLAGHTQALVAVSRSEARTFVESGVAPRERVRVVENGIDPTPWGAAEPVARASLDLPEGVPLALVVGLLNKAKGQDLAIEMLTRPGLERLCLAIAGPGEDFAALEERARVFGVQDRVRLLGYRDDVPALMRTADFLLLSSRWEGMPRGAGGVATGRRDARRRRDGRLRRRPRGHPRHGDRRRRAGRGDTGAARAGARRTPGDGRSRGRASTRGVLRRAHGQAPDRRLRDGRVRILHVITTLDVGGAEMHLLSQVRGQAARGHEPSVVYLKGEGTLADDFRAAGAGAVERIGAHPLRLARRARQADLVHSHLLKADMLTALVARVVGFSGRLVSSKHNDEQVLKRPLVSFVHGVLGRIPRRTIVLSDHVGRFFVEHGRLDPERIVRIYYGLDPAPFERAVEAALTRRPALRAELGLGTSDLVFTCVARFAPQKAHDVLLRAFRRARDERGPDRHQDRGTELPQLRLLLVGDDPFGDGRVRAEALARELELGDAVVFAGIRRDVPDVLAASDVFTMSSLWEGLGLVFLEAMATGLPVLASGVSAVPEVVVDGETGVLVPPSDVPALAAGLLELAGDAERRDTLGAAGRLRVAERFAIDRMVDETLAVYAAVLAGE